MSEKKLTPTENLALEVLIARYRLGEHLWTFDKSAERALEGLASKGITTVLHGVTEHTVRAMLTDEAQAAYLGYDYIPPIAQNSKKLAKKFRKITKEAKKLKKALKGKTEKPE